MRRSLLLLIPPLLACEPVAEPLLPGEVEVELAMVPQTLVFDDRGMHLEVLEVALALGHPSLGAQPSEAWSQAIVRLRSGERAPWARWEGSAGGVFEGAIEPRPNPEFEAHVAVVLSGVYNGLLAVPELHGGAFVLPLAVTVPIQVDVPAEDLAEHGARYRVVLDPASWLYDAAHDRLVPLEQLLGHTPSPTHPLVQQIAERMRAQIRVERVD